MDGRSVLILAVFAFAALAFAAGVVVGIAVPV